MTTTRAAKKTTKPKTVKVKPIETLPRNPFVFEVLDLVSRQRSKAKKVQILKTYEDISIKSVLIWNFDESIISVLPAGEVPYTGYDEQNTYSGTLSTKLTHEIRKMHEQGSFSLGASDQQGHTTIRRETMFINILEGLHPLEAEIICLAKDKNLETKYKITKEAVSEAYPDIEWGNRS